MHPPPFLPLLLLLPLFTLSSPSPPLRLHTLHRSLHTTTLHPQEYIEITRPSPYSSLTPSCILPLLSHTFAYTYGLPPANASYSPPLNCTWSHALLHLSGSSNGSQYDRIAAVWLSGVELLRTSTPEPSPDGIFWNVRKDVTKYSSLLQQPNLTLSVMLQNIVDKVYTASYHLNLTFLFYNVSSVNATVFPPFQESTLDGLSEQQQQQRRPSQKSTLGGLSQRLKSTLERLSEQQRRPSKKSTLEGLSQRQKSTLERFLFQRRPSEKSTAEGMSTSQRIPSGEKSTVLEMNERPADLIVPISSTGEEGFWFKMEKETDLVMQGIKIPPNVFKAVVEVYVSFHGNDEFWYQNPPDAYIEMNGLDTPRGHGAYREVLVKIDDNVVGSVIPMPVVFAGGINPLFWEPVVAIGAFDLPSYEIELTPFLGMLLDGKVHYFGLSVADSISYWLVDANLHLWLDDGAESVQASGIKYSLPDSCVEREFKFQQLDGKFEIEGERESEYSGWVNSTFGNFTTYVSRKLEYENTMKYSNNGTEKEVKQEVKVKDELRIEDDKGNVISSTVVESKYPLKLTTSTQVGPEKDSYLMNTKLKHSVSVERKEGKVKSTLSNKQNSEGWILVQGHNVKSGSGTTDQRFAVKDSSGCYARRVSTVATAADSADEGFITDDTESFLCTPLLLESVYRF